MDSRRKPRSSWSRSTTELRPSAAETRRPLAGPATLGVTGTHEEPVRPGVEARRVAELGEVSPDGQQRLLRRILGKVDVAQDPVRHRMEPIAHRDGQAREGLLVTALRSNHQLGVHAPPVERPGESSALDSYGRRARSRGAIFVARTAGLLLQRLPRTRQPEHEPANDRPAGCGHEERESGAQLLIPVDLGE